MIATHHFKPVSWRGLLPAISTGVKLHRLLSAIFLLIAPVSASAATIDFTGLGKAEAVTIYGIRGGATGLRVWAGELTWAWLDGKPAGAGDSFYSYCVDIMNDERDVQYNVGIRSTDAMSTDSMITAGNAAQKAVWLFDTFAANAHTSSSLAAGLQLAIWEVLFDTGNSLSSGSNFYVSGASTAAMSAGAWYLSQLNALGDGYLSAPSALWLDVASGRGQDQITRTVPEPTTLALLATGALAAVIRRRKSSQA